MNMTRRIRVARFGDSSLLQGAILVLVMAIMGSLNAFVDDALHPDIPFFDKEHLIVGGATALVSAVIYLLLVCYIRRLNKALNTIQALEALLPICSYCKKIRKPDADPALADSWQQMEIYISERTSSKFTHGICPECMAEKFPEAHAQLYGKPE